jgi:hypothetical protein
VVARHERGAENLNKLTLASGRLLRDYLRIRGMCYVLQPLQEPTSRYLYIIIKGRDAFVLCQPICVFPKQQTERKKMQCWDWLVEAAARYDACFSNCSALSPGQRNWRSRA